MLIYIISLSAWDHSFSSSLLFIYTYTFWFLILGDIWCDVLLSMFWSQFEKRIIGKVQLQYVFIHVDIICWHTADWEEK